MEAQDDAAEAKAAAPHNSARDRQMRVSIKAFVHQVRHSLAVACIKVED